ncbi:MAG: hypothetical protein O2971_16585 [Proteobacteria bacterium]|nr:hypothetical protein [Pseudomonadota bacterium]
MSADSEKRKKAIRNIRHWFKAIKHESKMIELPDDIESMIGEWDAHCRTLPDEHGTMTLKFLEQARLSLNAGDKKQLRIWLLRARKLIEGANTDDLIRGGPAKRKGGAATARINAAIRAEKAIKAAKLYDSMTDLSPKERIEIIAERMNVHRSTVLRYLKQTSRR